MHFSKHQQELTLVTPNNPRLTFDRITYIEGLKPMHMYGLEELYYVALRRKYSLSEN